MVTHFPLVLVHFLTQEHTPCGLQMTKLSYEAETLDTGFCVGLSELDFFQDRMGRGRTLETQGQSAVHGSLEYFPPEPIEEPDSHQQHFQPLFPQVASLGKIQNIGH